jgi:hypothetical protein
MSGRSGGLPVAADAVVWTLQSICRIRANLLGFKGFPSCIPIELSESGTVCGKTFLDGNRGADLSALAGF